LLAFLLFFMTFFKPALSRPWFFALAGVALLLAALGWGWFIGLAPPKLPKQASLPVQMNDRIAQLHERLALNPGDTTSWLMLARSLKVSGRYPEADAAYARAGERVHQDPNLLADWIEARILSDEQHFDETSLALLTQAIALAPQHPKVLLLHGLAALDLDDPATARQAFMVLRAQHAPGSADHQAMSTAIERIDRGEDPRTPAAAPASPAASPPS